MIKENSMRKISPWGAVAASVCALSLGLGGLALATDTPTSTPTSPSQQEALAGLETARQYILAHPDAPLPTPSASASASATPTPSTTPSASTSPAPSVSTSPSSTPTAPTAFASGLPWSSGVGPQPQSASVATGFQSMRGRTLDNITVFPARDSWSTLMASWPYDAYPAGFKGDYIFSMPLWPGNGSVATNYDTQWKQFATALSAKDPDAIVRLGWEMNLPGMYWKVTSSNQSQWIAAFNRAVVAMRSVAPKIRIAFNPNWGGDQTGVNVQSNVFPGVKANVDIYGIDMYDSYPADTSDSAANDRLTRYGGLQQSLNFAKANGKKFALPEWGVACNGSGCQWQGNAGGDNPRYINDTLSFLGANKAYVAFDSYFEEPASYIRSNLVGSTNPKAAAAYKAKLTALATQ